MEGNFFSYGVLGGYMVLSFAIKTVIGCLYMDTILLLWSGGHILVWVPFLISDRRRRGALLFFAICVTIVFSLIGLVYAVPEHHYAAITIYALDLLHVASIIYWQIFYE